MYGPLVPGVTMKFRFTYTGIRVRDMGRALDFYTKVLGMKVAFRAKAPQTRGEFAGLESEGSEQFLEVNWYAEDSPVAEAYKEGEELDHLAFQTEDLDAALSYLKEKGHPTVMGPIESEAARWAYVKDPDGIWVEVFETKEKQE